MGGFPAWAVPFLLLKGGEMVGDAASQGMKLFDWHKQQGNEREAADAARDYGLADDPKDVQEIMYGLGSRYKVKDPTTISTLRTQGQSLIDRFKKDQQDTAYKSGIGKLVQFVKENPEQPIGNALTALGPDEAAAFGSAMKGGADDFLKSFTVGRAEVAKTAADKQKAENIAGFQSAIGGLDAPSESAHFDGSGTNDLSRFAQRGGYAPITDVTSDIRQAAAAYNVGDSDEVNKAIQRAEETYNKTMLPPVSGKIGGKPITGQYNLMGDFRKDAEDKSTTVVNNTKINTGAPADAVASDAQAVLDGRLALSALSKRNGHDARVRAAVLKMNPGFNFTQAEANAKYATNPSNLQSRALIQGVEPLYTKLEEAGAKLGNSSVPGVNRVRNWYKEQTGAPDIVAFNNLRDDVIAESERILLGSGVLSDSKYMRAVQNVNSAQSVPQLQAAVKQLRLTVRSRIEALDKNPYPDAGARQQQPTAAKPQITPQQAAAELARRRAGGR